MKPSRFAAFAMLAAAVSFWGASYPITRYALGFIPPFTLGFARFVCAALLLAAFARPRTVPPPGERAALFFLGLTGSFLFVGLMNLGMRLTTGVAGSLLSATPPVLTALLAAAFLGEALRRGRVAGLAVGVVGVCLVAGAPPDGALSAAGLISGNAIVLLAQLCWSAYTMLGRRFAVRDASDAAALWTTAVGAVLLLPFSCVELLRGAEVRLTTGSALALLYLGTLNTAVAYLFWNRALRTVGASTAAGFQYLQPLSGALVSIAFLGERLSPPLVAGAALILGGVWLVLRGDIGDAPSIGTAGAGL